VVHRCALLPALMCISCAPAHTRRFWLSAAVRVVCSNVYAPRIGYPPPLTRLPTPFSPA
jgi:hypothetical protein